MILKRMDVRPTDVIETDWMPFVDLGSELDAAIASDDPGAVLKLIMEGADVHDSNLGLTPLMNAALGGRLKVIPVLLDAGAQLEEKDRCFGRTPLLWAASAGHWEVVRLLVERGANVNVRSDVMGWTPLMWAAKRGEFEMIYFLTNRGANK